MSSMHVLFQGRGNVGKTILSSTENNQFYQMSTYSKSVIFHMDYTLVSQVIEQNKNLIFFNRSPIDSNVSLSWINTVLDEHLQKVHS